MTGAALLLLALATGPQKVDTVNCGGRKFAITNPISIDDTVTYIDSELVDCGLEKARVIDTTVNGTDTLHLRLTKGDVWYYPDNPVRKKIRHIIFDCWRFVPDSAITEVQK